ncbi:hypothetical protein [Microbulbifer magnicolonia]|uniref:hypothetical protein n=1 Tax=Microbulbifer magnicolonia TaxID=3109744 RepID=UPI002B4082C7|nr:hypothetical protein [Microbulbifer sp. GG15]
MKPISTILRTSTQLKSPMGSSELKERERDVVAYFFLRLRMINGEQFDRLFPDERTEALAKREYAAHLKDFSREEIDRGIAAYHENRQYGVNGFQFLDVDRAIGLIKNSGLIEGNPARIHKLFEPQALPDKTAEEKSRRAGARELEKMRSLFDTPDSQTPSH